MVTLDTLLKTIIVLIVFNTALLSQLKLTTYTDKDVYEYGETIILYCKVTNTADTTFEFFAPTYQSCQAEFSFNDFKSWEYTACLATTELLTFQPHASKIYSWRIEPISYGLPNKEGTQTIIGKYYFDLKDTIQIEAPLFLGGEISVGYQNENADSIQLIKDSLDINVIEHDQFENTISEKWEIGGHQTDSVLKYLDSTELFLYAENAAFVEYENIIDENPLDYYPLQVGNYWQYEVEKRGVFPSDSADWIAYTEVIGDTTMPNGNKYFVLNEKGMNLYNQLTYKKYMRIDSSKANVYEYRYDEEFLIDSLQMEVGDEFDCLGLANIYFKNVFGTNTQIRSYHQTCVTTTGSFNYELAKNFGKVHSVITETNVYAIDFKFDLVYAKINGKEYGKLVDVNNENNFPEIPTKFSLSQNYPNPFNPTTTIQYSVPSSSAILTLPSRQAGAAKNLNDFSSQNPQLNGAPQTRLSEVRNDNVSVELVVYDILGRKVKTLVNQKQLPGNYEVEFNASKLASGMYFYRLNVGASTIRQAQYSAGSETGFVETKKMIVLK